MKILVCAHEAPIEPFDGFRGPVAALIGRLLASHDVRVLAVRAPDQDAVASDGMTLVERRSGTTRRSAAGAIAMSRGRPRGVDELAALLAGPLRRALEEFSPDVVHLTSGRLAGLAPEVSRHPAVLAAFDALHLNVAAAAAEAAPLRAPFLRGEVKRWKRFEARSWSRFDAVTVVSTEDAEALRALAPAMPLHMIGAGVDAERYAPDPAVARVPGRIAFHGVLGYAPNVAAATHLALNVFPLVRAEYPAATLTLAGRDPAPEVSALASIPGVEVTGAVPDMVAVLSSASVYACPMRSGTGVKNKLLEAAANGLACVATPIATQGLGPRLRDAVAVGGDDRTLAEHVVRLMRDDDGARRAGAAARAAVAAEHAWPAVVRAYEELYQTVIDRRLAAAGGSA